jgi:hypothetical protein
MHNNHYKTNQQQRQLLEGLQYRDLEGLMKPTVYVDAFSSKMGDDADIIVLSFFVRDKSAAKDLVSWFEKGYDFVLDADRSPGEIKPSRYLVYVEMRRRTAAPDQIQELLSDLGTLTEFEPQDWIMRIDDRDQPWDPEVFRSTVPLTPNDYQRTHQSDLNEMRVAAGLPVRRIYTPDPELRSWQSAAGI